MYLMLDVTLCTASILNLTALSVDRFLIITRPFQYSLMRTPPLMLALIAFVWITALVVSASAYLWPDPSAAAAASIAVAVEFPDAQLLATSTARSNNEANSTYSPQLHNVTYAFEGHPFLSGPTPGPVTGPEFRAAAGESAAPPPYMCDYPPFLSYQLYATATAFYGPMVLICLLWSRIFCVARRMSLVDRKQSDLRERCAPAALLYSILSS